MRLAGLVLLTACSFTGASSAPRDGTIADSAIDGSPDAPKPDGAPGSGRKRRITVDPSKVSGAQSQFPMWFVFDDPSLGQRALADGSDIYFTLPDGTPLEHERQTWNKATGHLEAWVRVDLLDTQPTLLDLRYGDPGPAHAPDPPQVFAQQFAAVWHLEDSLAATAIADARGSVPGTATGGLAPANHVTATLGSGIRFDGVANEILFANPLLGGGDHTISAWVDVVTPVGSSFSSVVTVGSAMANQSRWFHTHFPNVAVGFYGGDFTTTGVTIENQGPTLMHWVYDHTTKVNTLYKNGMMVATSPAETIAVDTQGAGGHVGNAPGPWGAGGNTTNPLKGTLDEVRLATAPRTAGWIATEYANQHAPASFYVVGSEQQAP